MIRWDTRKIFICLSDSAYYFAFSVRIDSRSRRYENSLLFYFKRSSLFCFANRFFFLFYCHPFWSWYVSVIFLMWFLFFFLIIRRRRKVERFLSTLLSLSLLFEFVKSFSTSQSGRINFKRTKPHRRLGFYYTTLLQIELF